MHGHLNIKWIPVFNQRVLPKNVNLADGIIVVVCHHFTFLNQLTNSEPCVKISLEDNTTPLFFNFLQSQRDGHANLWGGTDISAI
jgi:hypothetical protein